jgi:hypothetical protein
MQKNFQINGILVVVDPKVVGYESYLASIQRAIYHIVVINGGDSVKEMYQTIAQLRLTADEKEAVWMDKLLNHLFKNQTLKRSSHLWPIVPRSLLEAIQGNLFTFANEERMMFVNETYILSFN